MSICIELCTQYPYCSSNAFQCSSWCICSKSTQAWLWQLEGWQSRMVPSWFQIWPNPIDWARQQLLSDDGFTPHISRLVYLSFIGFYQYWFCRREILESVRRLSEYMMVSLVDIRQSSRHRIHWNDEALDDRYFKFIQMHDKAAMHWNVLQCVSNSKWKPQFVSASITEERYPQFDYVSTVRNNVYGRVTMWHYIRCVQHNSCIELLEGTWTERIFRLIPAYGTRLPSTFSAIFDITSFPSQKTVWAMDTCR